MTWARLRETRQGEIERRALQMGYPSTGYSYADPSAIPPPGMYHLQRAGVVVNAHALALDTPILTTHGWKTMGTVQTGDYVYAEDGAPTRITHVSEIFHKTCYEVSFGDGSTITATEDHLWRVFDAFASRIRRQENRAWETLPTRDLAKPNPASKADAQNRWRVRCDAVPQTPEATLPIDPYVFGYWLGDGSSDAPRITVSVADAHNIRAEIARAGYRVVGETAKVTEWGEGLDIRFANDAPKGHGIGSQLKRLGVWRNKHIPEQYLTASPDQRRALLAGLLDSDGCCSNQPTVLFSAQNALLARQVHELARGLGARAILRHPGNRADGCYTVAWTPAFNPFRLARKAERVLLRDPSQVYGRRLDLMSITGIRPVATVPTRCIAVEHDSHVFLAGRTFVPTHNTMLQVDVVYTALRLISNNVLRMGNLLPYTWGWSDDNIRYRNFIRDERPILTDTFGGGSLGGVAGSMMQCTGMDRTVWSMGLFGEAFWYILRDDLLNPLAVEVLHPAFMEVKRKDGRVEYLYGTGSNKKSLEPENVVHIPLKSLPGANRALSPTDYAGVAGALAMAAYEFGSSWFSQGQSPNFILSTDQKLGAAEVERIADKFMIRHAGLAQAHTPLVIDSGLKAEKVMASPDEAQYLNTLEYARQVIGAWFGIPPSKMPNTLQRQPASPAHTRQEEQIAFYQDTLIGYTAPLEEVFSAMLPAGEFACFDEDQLSKPDAQFLAQQIQALRITQAASVNDVRTRVLSWPPADDPRADDVLAPLASNTAPSQTGSTAPQSAKPGMASEK